MLEEQKAELEKSENQKDNQMLVDDGRVFSKLEVAENSFDAILHFNEDMKILAMNAYQMQELLDYTAKENELIIDWLSRLEALTVNNYEDMVYFENLENPNQN